MPPTISTPCSDATPLTRSAAKAKPDAYSAVRWSAASRYGAQFVQFTISLVMARLLAPEHFGLLGMATVLTGFAKTFNNLGFNAAIIQRDDIDQRLLSTLFWVNLLLCSVITAIVIVLAPWAAEIYGDPRVTPLVITLAFPLLLVAFTTVPAALLQRELEFRTLAVREIGSVVITGAVGVILACLGFGVWSLVAASLSGAVASVLLLNLSRPFIPSFVIDHPRLKECMRFGLNMTGTGILNYFSRNADNLIIGLFLGPAALGFYTFAYRLMLLPRDAVSQVVSRVLFPRLARIKDDEQLASIYLSVCGAIAFICFPIMGGLWVVSDLFVQVIVGAKWQPAVPLIAILAPVGAAQSLTSTTGQVLLAKGRSDLLFRRTVVESTVLTLAFLVGVQWSLIGVATALATVSIFTIPFSFYLSLSLITTLTWARLGAALAPPAIGTAAMCACTLVVEEILVSLGVSDVATLVSCVVLGVLFYAAIAVLTKPAAYSLFMKLVLFRSSLPKPA